MSSPLFGRDEAKANIVVVEEPDIISLLSGQRDEETNSSVEEPVEKNENNEGNNESEIAQLNRPLFDLQIIEAKPPNYLPSPILQFPPEIISHIFYLTLSHSIFPFHTGDYLSLFKKDRTTPFILGAVCRYWRAVTWSTPILWSFIVVRFLALNNNKSTLVKDWISRSGQHPLSIRIVFRPIRSTAEADFRFFADIINQCSSRWRHFDLSVPAKFSRFIQAEGTQGHAPMLESLRLDIRGRRSKFDLVTCPRLRKVHLASVRLKGIRFPWNNVTHLCTQAMTFEDCLEILQNTPFLVHAEFIDIEGWADSFTDNPIVIPVKSLKVVGSYAAFFFSHLTCPALEELICAMPPAKIVKHITPFLERSGPLRSFSMSDFALSALDLGLTNLLQTTPSLTHLAFSQKKHTSWSLKSVLSMLDWIHSKQNDPLWSPFLPHLETFEYTDPFGFTKMERSTIFLPDSIFCEPHAYASSLGSVKLLSSPSRWIPYHFIPLFLGLMEQGLTLKVRSCGSEDILQSTIDYYRDEESHYMNKTPFQNCFDAFSSLSLFELFDDNL